MPLKKSVYQWLFVIRSYPNHFEDMYYFISYFIYPSQPHSEADLFISTIYKWRKWGKSVIIFLRWQNLETLLGFKLGAVYTLVFTYYHLFRRQTPAICWFIPQMPLMWQQGRGQWQELGTQSRSPTGLQAIQPLLPSVCWKQGLESGTGAYYLLG